MGKRRVIWQRKDERIVLIEWPTGGPDIEFQLKKDGHWYSDPERSLSLFSSQAIAVGKALLNQDTEE